MPVNDSGCHLLMSLRDVVEEESKGVISGPKLPVFLAGHEVRANFPTMMNCVLIVKIIEKSCRSQCVRFCLADASQEPTASCCAVIEVGRIVPVRMSDDRLDHCLCFFWCGLDSDADEIAADIVRGLDVLKSIAICARNWQSCTCGQYASLRVIRTEAPNGRLSGRLVVCQKHCVSWKRVSRFKEDGYVFAVGIGVFERIICSVSVLVERARRAHHPVFCDVYRIRRHPTPHVGGVVPCPEVIQS